MRSISSCSPPALHLPGVFCIFSLLSSITAEDPRPQCQLAGSERQLPEHRLANTTSLQGIIRDTHGNAIPDVQVDLGNTAGPEKYSVITGAGGIFRLRNVQLGVYRVTLAKPAPGQGQTTTPHDMAQEAANRMIAIFKRGADVKRPCFGPYKKFQYDPHRKDYLLFHEYYHGDSGMGLGSSHQTAGAGWSRI